MQTTISLRTKNNIIYASPGCLVLKKTGSRRRQLIFTDILVFGIIGFFLFGFIQANRTRFKVPQDLIGWAVIFAFLGALFYFLFDLVRKTFNECKAYAFSVKDSTVMVNGKTFGSCATVKLKIFEQIGYKGIGKSYKIRLNRKGKGKTLSFGNQLPEAEKVTSQISSFLGTGVEKMWKK